MNDPLAQLKDIHLPPPVSWWPPAPGWWLLAALLLAMIAGIVAYVLWRRKYHAWRKAALQELAQLEKAVLPHEQAAEALSALIRRAAITAEQVYGKPAQAAHLQGLAWQQTLQAHMPDDMAHWLAIDRYRPGATIDQARLFAATRQWLKGYKP